MKPAKDMTEAEKHECLDDMLTFIQSAVESEQDEPQEFKVETEKRIHFVYTNIRELLGLPSSSS
jgi:hypothetical protein